MTVVNLKTKYEDEIRAKMKDEFGYSNAMQIPRLEKISLNMGLGEAVKNPKIIESAVEELSLLSGQKPIVTLARRAIATYKLRQGMPIGAKVTLRRIRMYEFLDRLISVSLPRVRDFKGVSPKGFDGRGNFSMGVREQIIFPEINYDKIARMQGLNITIVTSAKTDDEARSLLSHFGMPFRR